MDKKTFDEFIKEKLEAHGSYDMLSKFLEHGEKARKPHNDEEAEDYLYGMIYDRLTNDQLIIKKALFDPAKHKISCGKESQAAIFEELKEQTENGNAAFKKREEARKNHPLGKNMKPEKKMPIPTSKGFYKWLKRKGLDNPGTSPRPKKIDAKALLLASIAKERILFKLL